MEEAETEAETRQEEEVQVLKAVYDEDFEDLRQKDVWKVERPPEFTLKLKPLHDSKGNLEENVSVKLRVKFGREYPKEAPERIDVVEAKGLSNELIAQLTSQLKFQADVRIGEVMITELAQFASEWLVKHNKPAFESFYEEMEARKKSEVEAKEKRLALERAESQAKESEEMEQVRLEVAKKEREMQEARIKWKKQKSEVLVEAPKAVQRLSRTRRSSSLSESHLSSSQHALGTWDEAEDVRVTFKGEELKLQKIANLGGNALGGVVHLAKLNNKLVAVAEWIFKNKRYDDMNMLTKQLASIEQELQALQRLPPHPNVVQYVGFAQQKFKKHVRILVVEEFAFGSNLSYFLSENVPMELELLKRHVEGILSALEYMHKHNFVHRDLRDSSVFVDSRGCVKVADFSIDKRVRDVFTSETEERFPIAIGRGGEKSRHLSLRPPRLVLGYGRDRARSDRAVVNRFGFCRLSQALPQQRRTRSLVKRQTTRTRMFEAKDRMIAVARLQRRYRSR